MLTYTVTESELLDFSFLKYNSSYSKTFGEGIEGIDVVCFSDNKQIAIGCFAHLNKTEEVIQYIKNISGTPIVNLLVNTITGQVFDKDELQDNHPTWYACEFQNNDDWDSIKVNVAEFKKVIYFIETQLGSKF